MGTKPNKKLSNDITISRSINNRSVDPISGKATITGAEQGMQPAQTVAAKQPERSFAQPSPVTPAKPITPKAHASESDEKEALKKNSLKKVEPEVIVGDEVKDTE